MKNQNTMDQTLSDVKDLVTLFRPIIDPLVSTIIRPQIDRLSKIVKKREIKDKLVDNFFENKFSEYLARTLNNVENINILIFQNQQIKLKDIYYPLTIESHDSKKPIKYHLDDFKLEYINPYKRILISDTAGMGKSTISKFITLKTIENNLAIPILIELRNLKEDHTVLDEILFQFNPIDNDFDQDLILKFLELGKFLILFDGFDEIQFKGQENIIKDIHGFIKKTSNNQFIITSRPEGSLASFGHFQLFNILALNENEAFKLIRKYDSISINKVGDKLIQDLKKNFGQTIELLGNPFLVSLIYSTYTYNKDIPSNKVTFYEEIYSALYKRHDLSKEGWVRPKVSQLDIQQFKVILRQLAFDTAVVGTIVYTESEILHYIKITKEKCPGVEFKESDFLSDLLSAVPLFQKDGSKIKWAHKSLQDYFAADFIAFNSKKEIILNRIYGSGKGNFLNILDLFYELDYKTFRKTIVRTLLNKFILYFESSYQNLKGISEDAINERKIKSFGVETFVFNGKDTAKGEQYDYKYIQKLIPKIDDENRRLTFYDHKNIFILFFMEFDLQIVNLLYNKQLPYIKEYDLHDHSINITSWKLKKFKLLEVNDDPSSLLNSVANFKKINLALNRLKIYYYSHLNYEESVIELKKINKDIENEISQDHFGDI